VCRGDGCYTADHTIDNDREEHRPAKSLSDSGNLTGEAFSSNWVVGISAAGGLALIVGAVILGLKKRMSSHQLLQMDDYSETL
jgi:hypothetical protein